MLSNTATYAVRAMAYIARHGADKPVLSQEIADEMEIPKNFLSKILNRLVQDQLILSTRGIKGGFQLARPGNEITLRDVASKFMNLDQYKTCFLGLKHCDGTCAVHKKYLPVQQGFFKMLDEITIDQVL